VAHLAVEGVEVAAVAVAVVVAAAVAAAAVAAAAAAWGVQAAAAAWDAAAWVVEAAVGLEVLAVAIQAVGVLDAAVVVKGWAAVEVVDVDAAAVVATGEEKVVASNGDSLDGESHEFWVRCFIASVARHVRPERASASPAWHI